MLVDCVFACQVADIGNLKLLIYFFKDNSIQIKIFWLDDDDDGNEDS